MRQTYTVILRAEPEGGYTVLVPALPEIVSYGESFDEAQRVAEEAIGCALLGRQDRGEPIPQEDTPVTLPLEDLTGALTLLRLSVPMEEAPVA